VVYFTGWSVRSILSLKERERDDFISKETFSPGAQIHKYSKLNKFVIKILHDSSRHGYPFMDAYAYFIVNTTL